MLSVYFSNKFRRDVKRLKKQGKDMSKLKEVVEMLCNERTLPGKYRDHKLVNDLQGFRDCHIEPDWVLIYRVDSDKLILVLSRTGSHSELGLSG